ncbi:MAG: sugar nucleotide-binding protein [Psychroflexus sp.]|nr:sugar nucleotide-binding protein [Psychroflexus sp.]
MLRIFIIGASGFLGQALFKELNPYFDVFGTYFTSQKSYNSNRRYYQWNVESEPLTPILNDIKPDIVITSFKGAFPAQVEAYQELISYVVRHRKKLMLISTSNVFDAFTNYPSYEYDKTLSGSIYGRFLIKIENALLRLPNAYYNILRLPMVFGKTSPRLQEILKLHKLNEAIDVFPKVIINATTEKKICQQMHYIINQSLQGVFHLGSTDVIHHKDLIEDICEVNVLEDPIFRNNYQSNLDRYLALLPKHNKLPDNYQISIQDVIKSSKIL